MYAIYKYAGALFLLLSAIVGQAGAADFTSIRNFNENHPQYAIKDVLGKTASLRAASDGQALKVQLCVRNDRMQRRLLHEGLDLIVDPAGTRSEICTVRFPALPPETESGRVANMVPALEGMPIILMTPTDTLTIPSRSASVEVDEIGYLFYTAVIPAELVSAEGATSKWQFGIISDDEGWNGALPSPPDQPGEPREAGNRPERPERQPQDAPDNATGGGMGGPGGMGGGMGGPGGGMGGPGGGMGGPGGGMGGGQRGQGGPRGGGRGMRGEFNSYYSASGVNDRKVAKLVNNRIEEWTKISYSDITK